MLKDCDDYDLMGFIVLPEGVNSRALRSLELGNGEWQRSVISYVGASWAWDVQVRYVRQSPSLETPLLLLLHRRFV